MKNFALVLLLVICSYIGFSATYTADNSNYLALRDKLIAGDTLLLTTGDYLQGLRLRNINGSADKWIVIKSEELNKAVLIGRDGANTMDIENSSYISIEGLKFDGKNIADIDAIKAGGASSSYTHHIRILNNYITGHGNNQQVCGISTKITSWDWVISGNTIDQAGTGIYLGNSDGSMPFIRGIIEYNLVIHPVGYCMQIKHQNNRPAFQGIPTEQATTIIRHNVFAKDDRPSPDGDRPNLLVGGQPLTGSGVDDRVEIYGNLLYHNPREYLFQGTGNISIHDNILIDSDLGGLNITPQNSRNPKEIFIYNNSLLIKATGIRLSSPNTSYKQILRGNAVFAVTCFAPPGKDTNFTANYSEADKYIINPAIDLKSTDLYPKNNSLTSDFDLSAFSKDIDYDKDFNGDPQFGKSYGAYAGYGMNPGWRLALELKRKPSATGTIEIRADEEKIYVFPNPATDFIEISVGAGSKPALTNDVKIFDVFGQIQTTPSTSLPPLQIEGEFRIDVSELVPGMYFVRVGDKVGKFVKI